MSDILVCEDLATKAELQELRNQINQLLGQPENGGETIDVLQASTLAGTLVGSGLFYGFEIVEDTLKKGKVQISRFVSNGGKKLLSNASNIFSKNFMKASVATRTAQTAAQIGSALASSLDIIASVGLNIAVLNTLGYRIDETEKLIRSYDISYSSLLKILADQNEDIDAANANIQELATELTNQQTINQELSNEIEAAQINIDDLAAANEKQAKTIVTLQGNITELKANFEAYQSESIAEINNLKTYIDSLEADLIKSQEYTERLFDAIETLAENLTNYQARTTEIEDRIAGWEFRFSIYIAELLNLKIDIEEERDITDARITNLEAKVILGNKRISSGSGISSGTRNAIAGQQNKTLELMNKLAGNPISELPDISYSNVSNGSSSFEALFDQLLPQISTAQGGETVDVDELATRINSDFTNSLVTLGIAGLPGTVNEIRQQTRPEAITSATGTAICNSTASGGCMNNDVFRPLRNKLDDVGTGLGLIGEGANLSLNNSILNRVTDIQNKVNDATFGLQAINNFMKKAWENTKLDKVLEERSFPWMDENVNFRNPFGGFLQKLDTTEEIVSQVGNLVASGREAQENFNQIFEQSSELKTASQKLQENLSNFDIDKETTEVEEVANSAAPDIDRLDLIQLEPDEI